MTPVHVTWVWGKDTRLFVPRRDKGVLMVNIVWRKNDDASLRCKQVSSRLFTSVSRLYWKFLKSRNCETTFHFIRVLIIREKSTQSSTKYIFSTGAPLYDCSLFWVFIVARRLFQIRVEITIHRRQCHVGYLPGNHRFCPMIRVHAFLFSEQQILWSYRHSAHKSISSSRQRSAEDI